MGNPLQPHNFWTVAEQIWLAGKSIMKFDDFHITSQQFSTWCPMKSLIEFNDFLIFSYYPLVIYHSELENPLFFLWIKTHYFDWAIFNSYFDITRGYIHQYPSIIIPLLSHDYPIIIPSLNHIKP